MYYFFNGGRMLTDETLIRDGEAYVAKETYPVYTETVEDGYSAYISGIDVDANDVVWSIAKIEEEPEEPEEPEEETEADMWDEMATAIQEGVDSI